MLLTTITTIGGLMPILLETSIQAQILIPMATSIAFGELFATIVVLYLVPVSYSLYWSAGGSSHVAEHGGYQMAPAATAIAASAPQPATD